MTINKDTFNDIQYAGLLLANYVAKLEPQDRAEWTRMLHKQMVDGIQEDIPHIHHHVVQRLKDTLYKALEESQAAVAHCIDADYIFYTSFEIIPTRHPRRQKRRYAEFCDQYGRKTIKRMTTKTPDEFIDWCTRQLGEKAGFMNISMKVLPVHNVHTINFTVTPEKATRIK